MESICGCVGTITDISTKIKIIQKAINASTSQENINCNSFARSLSKIYKYAFNCNELKRLLKK